MIYIKKTSFILLAALFFIINSAANAHCDGLDGPVVKSAKEALKTENINHVLKWVEPEYEEEIKMSFDKSLKVRQISNQARELADNYFFETVVRLHRKGEGENYDGLKPAGRDLGPAIPAADVAVEKGSVKQLRELLVNSLNESLDHTFNEMLNKKNFDVNNVKAGREFVEKYVQFLHLAEKLYEVTSHKMDHNIQ